MPVSLLLEQIYTFQTLKFPQLTKFQLSPSEVHEDMWCSSYNCMPIIIYYLISSSSQPLLRGMSQSEAMHANQHNTTQSSVSRLTIKWLQLQGNFEGLNQGRRGIAYIFNFANSKLKGPENGYAYRKWLTVTYVCDLEPGPTDSEAVSTREFARTCNPLPHATSSTRCASRRNREGIAAHPGSEIRKLAPSLLPCARCRENARGWGTRCRRRVRREPRQSISRAPPSVARMRSADPRALYCAQKKAGRSSLLPPHRGRRKVWNSVHVVPLP